MLSDHKSLSLHLQYLFSFLCLFGLAEVPVAAAEPAVPGASMVHYD